jgi:DNA/RNA-binding protein KIN17
VYIGIIKILDMDSIIKVDQEHLETVIPAIGKKVFIVNGAYRGLEAILEHINEKMFSVKLSIASVYT